jgi:hypothetical protein
MRTDHNPVQLVGAIIAYLLTVDAASTGGGYVEFLDCPLKVEAALTLS